MPVAGPVGLGTAAAIQDAGEGSAHLGRHRRLRERRGVLLTSS